jgi:Ca2+:H+ antiporter
VAASVLAAWMSEVLVSAAESGSAITMARRNKMDLTIGITLGSSIQIGLFVAPALVLASYFLAPQPLNLSFGRAEVGSLFVGVILGTVVWGDGQSNWYKGVQLITIYSIMALMFFLIPDVAR